MKETPDGKYFIPDKKIFCPECGGTNVLYLAIDGGCECQDCQTDEHESWFWPVICPACDKTILDTDSAQACDRCGRIWHEACSEVMEQTPGGRMLCPDCMFPPDEQA